MIAKKLKMLHSTLLAVILIAGVVGRGRAIFHIQI
jgi:hypothetical protein